MAIGVQHLVGREEELAALLDLLGAVDKLPTVATLVGEAGIGKTTVLRVAAEAAEDQGYRVLCCRPAEAEVRLSFVGLADLIGGVVPDVLPRLPRPQRRALEVALALTQSDDAAADERVVAFAFLSALRTLSSGTRLVVAVDDVQWLDAPSLAMLQFALSRLETEPVAAIITARDEVPVWLRRGVPEERLVTLRLGPLSLGAVHELLRTRMDAVFPRPTLLRLWEASGGNPFLALELASALRRHGGSVNPGEELPIPATLEMLVHERLDRLGAFELEVARIVAALANPTVDLVEAAAGRRAGTGLSRALEAGILEIHGALLRFTHPLLRSAVAARSPPGQRRSLHARLAELVSEPEERARHLALATSQPDREVASIVEKAAESVHARGATAAAAELAELAVGLTPPGDVEDVRRRVIDCAERQREAGDVGRAIALLEQALAAAHPGLEHAAVLARLAYTVAHRVDPRTGVDLYREALVEAEGNATLEAEIHLNLADLVRVTEDRNQALAHAELAIDAASRAGDAALRCQALATFGFIHFWNGRGIPRERMDEALALDRSLPAGRWPFFGRPTLVLTYQLVWVGFIDLSRGDAATALRHLERAWEIRDGVRLLEPGHRFELGDTLEALIAVGELEEAEQRLIPWEKQARALDRASAIAVTARCRALLLGALGDLAGAQAAFAQALAEHARIQNPFQHARTLLALGVIQRRAKQRGAARMTLEEALAIFDQLGAPLWADKARSELARIGGRTPSRGELTEAERRIATLVAEGRTNREVAAALFVTEHTVEGALTRAYRKLGVRSRTELAHRLGHEN